MSDTLDVYRSGTGKVLGLGDYVKIDGKAALYRITALRQTAAGVEVDAYGGKEGRLGTRTVTVERLSLVRRPTDPNEPLREAVRNVSNAAKTKRRGGIR